MTFQLPDFSVGYLVHFHACATLDSPPSDLLNWVKAGSDERRLGEFAYESQRGKAFVVLLADAVTDVDSPYIHFHSSCALPSFFEDEMEHECLNASRVEADEIFAWFRGKKLTRVRIQPEFRVPAHEIPKRGAIGLMLGAKTTVAGANIAVNGVHYGIADDPMDMWKSLSWITLDDQGREISIRIGARIPDVLVTDNYLRDFQEMAEEGFTRYVLERDEEGS